MIGTTSSNGTVCVRKISDGKLLQKLERVHSRIVGSLGAGNEEYCGAAA